MEKNSAFAEGVLFFVKNIKSPLVNGALVPSSSASVKAMLEGIDFSTIKTIVELGPGTGPYTAELIKRSLKDTKIILIEIDSDYANLLRKKFGDRVIVENAGAENLGEILRRHGIDYPDLIISALPFLSLGKKEELFENIRQYTQQGTIFRFEMILRPWGNIVYKTLPIQKKSYIWKNVPPMWIYGIN